MGSFLIFILDVQRAVPKTLDFGTRLVISCSATIKRVYKIDHTAKGICIKSNSRRSTPCGLRPFEPSAVSIRSIRAAVKDAGENPSIRG